MIEITIPGIPIPWRAPYVGSRGAYSPGTKVMMQLRDWLRTVYKGPLFATETLIMDVDYYMPVPIATSKKKREQMLSGNIRPAKTPDLDNLRKFSGDLLQTVVYTNDNLIVGGRSDKWYGEEPKTVIKIEAWSSERF